MPTIHAFDFSLTWDRANSIIAYIEQHNVTKQTTDQQELVQDNHLNQSFNLYLLKSKFVFQNGQQSSYILSQTNLLTTAAIIRATVLASLNATFFSSPYFLYKYFNPTQTDQDCNEIRTVQTSVLSP